MNYENKMREVFEDWFVKEYEAFSTSTLNDKLGILPCQFCNSKPHISNAAHSGYIISCKLEYAAYIV